MPWNEYNPPGRNPDINNWRDWSNRVVPSNWLRGLAGHSAPTTDPWGNALTPGLSQLLPAALTALQSYGKSTGRSSLALMRHPERYADNNSALVALREALLKDSRPFLNLPAQGALAGQAAPPITQAPFVNHAAAASPFPGT